MSHISACIRRLSAAERRSMADAAAYPRRRRRLVQWCVMYGLFTLLHRQFGQDYVKKSASVSCGQHSAPTCGKCPYHQHTGDWVGQPWCRGECKWHNNECLSQKVVEQFTFDVTQQVATATGELHTTKTALSSSSIVRKKCSDEWGEFSKGLLTQTKINSQPSLWDYETCYKKMYASGTLCHRDSWKGANSGLIIHPPSKFAFCPITKNGCSQWTTVLAKLFYDNSNIKHSQYDLSQKSFKKYGIEGLNSIFSDPDATKVVMARDPLARFASAYLDKCFEMNCSNPYCFPRTESESAVIQKGQPVTFRKAIKWILTQNVSRIDTHWKLQSEHCNLRTHISDYNIIALMDKGHMPSDASCIMDIAGINDYNKQNSTSIEPFWKPFHKMKNYRQESELDVLKKLFTPGIARLLVETFRQDYDIFQLPEPNWIEDSTGEWLDSTDHHRCVTIK